MTHFQISTHRTVNNFASFSNNRIECPKSSPERFNQGTVFTTLKSDIRRLTLRAAYFHSSIDLDLLKAHFPRSQVLSTDPLVLKMSEDAHVVVHRYGAVVFWQCNGLICANFLKEIQRVLEIDPPVNEVRDELVVRLDQAEECVNFKDIWLRDLTVEHVRIISESFAQSLALRQCELSVSQALKHSTPLVRALEARGGLIAPGKNILKTVGFTLAVREAILAKLSLFDDPAETWQSEKLSRLHNLLYDHFDIKKRLSALHEKLTFLSDLNTMLMNLLQNRTSHRLEWIVILLIVIEVALSIVHFCSSSH